MAKNGECENVIEIRDLRKSFRTRISGEGIRGTVKSLFAPEYRTTDAVRGISFTVERGEILAFVGPNGAGKSTTIKLITGILFPDRPVKIGKTAGDGKTGSSISVLGLNPQKQRRALSYRIGTVFGQKSQLWFHLPPRDSLLLLADIYDLERSAAKKRIGMLTEVFGIGGYIDVPVRKLSLGERIRCEIAASLLHRPEVLFLDEPTIGLDVVVKQTIRDLILKINQEEKTTIFLTSHDAGDIEKICRRAIVINHGTIVLDDSIKNLKYSFSSKKMIDLRLENPFTLDLAGVTVLKRKDYSAKIEIDLKKISLEEAIDRIVRENRILDITISNPPMEEIIASIYRREAPKA